MPPKKMKKTSVSGAKALFRKWRKQVENEDKSLKYGRKPTLDFGNIGYTYGRNEVVEKNDVPIKAKIRLRKKVLADNRIMELVAKHELRENLAMQNKATIKQAHAYALRMENKDLKKMKLTRRQFNYALKKIHKKR